MRALMLTAVCAVLVGLCQTSCAQEIKYTTGDPLQFGMGFNTLTGNYAGRCTVVANTADIQDVAAGAAVAPAQLTKWKLSSIDDAESLAQSLDASASIKTGFLFGSASLSTQYLNSRQFNSFHQFLVVSADVANSTKMWTKPQLTPDMKRLKDRDPLAFLRQCGDSFIQTVTTGGELLAILDIATEASEDKTSLQINLSGDYGSVEGKAKLKEEVQKAVSNRRVKVEVIRAGGAGAMPNYTADALVSATLTFPTTIAAAPVPMSARVASYETIYVGRENSVTTQKFIQPLFRAYMHAVQYTGDLMYMRANSSEFRKLDIPHQDTAVVAAVIAQAGNNSAPLAIRDMKESAYMRLLSKASPQPGPNDFSFLPVTPGEISVTLESFEGYKDQLTLLAQECLEDPKNKCSGAAPVRPREIEHVVRVFFPTKTVDTATGPVNINLDAAYTCRVENIDGNWRIGDAATAPISTCNALPHSVTNGHIVTGDFDSYYQDNHGVCTYQFVCYKRY